ncbi:MAG: tetratricopeptide repeat protein [Bacteroidota bacterium]|nr:tetratricopeptide repeat protein [Bacteroidota bacterium]
MKIVLLNLFLILSAINLFGQQADTLLTRKMDPLAGKYYSQAVELYKADKYDEAIVYLDSSIAVEKDFRTYFLKGQAQLKNADLEKAKATFNEVLKIYPTFDKAYFSLAQIELRSGNYDAAISNYEKIVQLGSTDSIKNKAKLLIDDTQKSKLEAQVSSLIKAGDEFAKTDKNTEAIEQYEKAKAINNSPVASYKEGQIYAKLKKYEEAVANFQNALANDKKDDNIKVYNNALYSVYIAMGNDELNSKKPKLDKALESFNSALKISESDIVHFYIGRVYTEKSKLPEALAEFQKAEQLKKSISDGALAFYRGVVYKKQNDKVKAKEEFTKAMEDAKYKKNAELQIKDMNAPKQKPVEK